MCVNRIYLRNVNIISYATSTNTIYATSYFDILSYATSYDDITTYTTNINTTHVTK